MIWEVCAPKWFDLWLRLCGRRPGNTLCGCCVLWARVAILPRLSTFRDEVASPFDSLSKKDVWGGRPSQLATGNCAFIGCITWSFKTCPTLARIWQVGLDEGREDVAFTEKSVLTMLLLRRKAFWTEVAFAKASVWMFQHFVFWDVKLCFKRFKCEKSDLKWETRFEMI